MKSEKTGDELLSEIMTPIVETAIGKLVDKFTQGFRIFLEKNRESISKDFGFALQKNSKQEETIIKLSSFSYQCGFEDLGSLMEKMTAAVSQLPKDTPTQ